MPRPRRRRARGECPIGATALAQYEAELEAIVTSGLPEKMPDVLYHYTTWSGFRGIVSSQQFYFRAHHCTNDPAELTSVDDIMIRIAKDLLRTVAPPLRRPLIAFLRDLPGRGIGKVAKVYLACFSLARDKPSQWIAYADHGKGVCLGLGVLHGEKAPSPKLGSLPVNYDEDRWRSSVGEKFRRVIDCHDTFGRTYRKGHARGEAAAWNALMRIAALASIGAKKPAWSSEEEWRTMVLDHGGEFAPLRREDGSEYIALRLRNPPLRFAFDEILLGPRQEIREAGALSAARLVLEQGGYPEEEMPPIRISTVDL
jgi:Protein of unknown function (DUF2971)